MAVIVVLQSFVVSAVLYVLGFLSVLAVILNRAVETMTEDPDLYKVVINHEEQYSLWPIDRDNPGGWRDAGKTGSREECLNFIREVWTDMRPLSVREDPSKPS